MAKKKVLAYVCDNPDCGVVVVPEPDGLVPGIILGKGQWALGGGGPIPELYVCSLEHVQGAVEAAMWGK